MEKTVSYLEQARINRAKKIMEDIHLMNLHKEVHDMLMSPIDGKEILEQAKDQVNKWERGAICNPAYISYWKEILSMPINFAMKKAMLRDDVIGVGMRKNSPFDFLFDELSI